MFDKPPIIVLGANGCNSLGLVRSFGRRRISPYVFRSGGFCLDHKLSRFAKVVNAPNPDLTSENLARFINDFSAKIKMKPVVFPVNDISLLYVLKYREIIEKNSYTTFGSSRNVSILLDKAKFHDFISDETSIKQPKTFFVNNLDEASSAANDIGFPCILKPSFNYNFTRKFFKKCHVIENINSLKECWGSFQIEDTTYLIQEIIPGSKIAGWTGYYDSETRLLAHCSYDKIRQFPADFGVGTLFCVTENTELLRQGREVLSRLHYHGIVDVEFKYDYRDSLWKIIEINPRTCMHNSLAAAAGVDIEFMAYSNILGLTDIEMGEAENGVLWIETHKDLASFMSESSRFLQWLSSLKGKRTFAYFAKDDPLPFIVRLNDFFSTVIGNLVRVLSKEKGRNL